MSMLSGRRRNAPGCGAARPCYALGLWLVGVHLSIFLSTDLMPTSLASTTLRILRSFLNIPIYAITTAYYCNDQGHTTRDSVQKVQWLDPMPESLKGKHVLVVDEVDDSRVTLQFCLEQLQQEDFASLGVAVLHEKIKEKKGILPPDIAYFSGLVTPDWWINYPWDADDITEHNALAAQKPQLP